MNPWKTYRNHKNNKKEATPIKVEKLKNIEHEKKIVIFSIIITLKGRLSDYIKRARYNYVLPIRKLL